jgi:hypothetical protein
MAVQTEAKGSVQVCPEPVKPAAVLATVKVRPGGVGGGCKLSVTADLDGVCAQRPRLSAVGAKEACGAVEQWKVAEEAG